MPYPIETKDKLTITGIPDDIQPTDQRLKDAVAKMRASGASSMTWEEIVPSKTTQDSATEQPRLLGQALEVIKEQPANLGVMARGAVQGLASGVTTLADPLTSFVNQFLPQEWQQLPPSEGLTLVLDKLGVPEAQNKAQEILQATGQGLGSAVGSIATGGALKAGAPILGAGTKIQEAGKILAAQPAQQIAGAAAAEGASQYAEQHGTSPLAQTAIGIGAGLVGSRLGSPVTKIAAKASYTEDELGEVVRKAATGNKEAQKTLADLSVINKAARDAAERLDIELPVDVFSDNPQVRAAAGLGRSVAGSAEEARWLATVKNAVDQADKVMEDFGATFIEGTPATAVASARVKDSMLAAKNKLKDQATKIYSEIEAAVPKTTPATFDSTKKVLTELVQEVGAAGMTTQEKQLWQMIKDPNTTYGRLMREKNLIGQAIAKKDSPYGNMETGALKRLYGALAEDQLSSVEKIGSKELKEKLVSANLLYGKERELGKQIVNLYGKDFSGSISDKMRAAISSSAKGDTGAFTRLMDQVPDDLRKEVTATALASIARSGQGATKGSFGFSEFVNTYKGIRANPEIYKKIAENLGSDSDKVLRDLYEVSKRVSDARASVLTTGKANQALLQGMTAQNVLEKVLSSVPGKSAITAGGAAIGGAVGGGVFGSSVGAGLSNAIVESLTNGEKTKLEAVGKLFRSSQFQDLMVEAATTNKISPEKAKALSRSEAFQSFAKAVKLPGATEQLDTWILDAALGEHAQSKSQYAASTRSK